MLCEHGHHSTTVTFAAQLRRTWDAELRCGILDTTPADDPDLFGDLTFSPRRLVVVDATVMERYGPRLRALLDRYGVDYGTPLKVPGGERAKRRSVLLRIIRAMEKRDVSRFGEPLLVWGGGALHDVAGLAASEFRRGVPWRMYSTTLVSAIDAGFALKVAINEPYKNRVGSYHPAEACYADPTLFATLDDAQILDGMGEVFKSAIAQDGELFALLETHGARAARTKFQDHSPEALAILARTIRAMCAELSANPYESDPRRPSYMGHGVSPAFEPHVTHGLAVVLDILLTTLVARARGCLDHRAAGRIFDLARTLGFPLWADVIGCADLPTALADTARHRRGAQLVPAPTGEPGTVTYLNDITADELACAVAELHTLADA